jgi:FkbM family methyltransferase
MTKTIDQPYKVRKYVPLKIKFYRFISKLIVNILFPFEKSLFRNSFSQYLKTYVNLNINNIALKFKDGNERLYLHHFSQYVAERDLVNWIDTFSKNDIFYDIGCNVGHFSIYAAKKNIKTYCFDGHFGNLSDLIYNIHLNNVAKKINLIPTLLGEKNECTNFCLRDFMASSAKSEINHKKSIFKSKETEALKLNTIVMRLDYFIDNKIIPQPSKVKIDVDGADYFVLKGMGKYLNKVDEILIEMYSRQRNDWKILKKFKNSKKINTKTIAEKFFLDIESYNPYFKEIQALLKEKKFVEIKSYGNNIIFKKNLN